MKGLKRSAAVLCLLSVVGCGREEPVAEKGPATVTNVVEVTREVVVTNAVTVTVTNVVDETREPVRILSARKTAPYFVSSGTLSADQLRKALSDAGARVIRCDAGAVALVEASDRAVRTLDALATVKPLLPADKVSVDAGENVRVIPLSSIDSAAVAEAIRALGGEIVQVVTVGSPAIRAKMSYKSIHKLAERGDVRRIERGEK